MRFHTYTKFSPEMADAVDLQGLLDKLADFLLQSGFAGGPHSHPYWGDFGGDDADRSLDGLKEAILNALIESGQFTPEMLEALRGDGDEEAQAKLAKLLDDLVQRLASEGYVNIEAPPQVPRRTSRSRARAASRTRPRATCSSTSPRRGSTSSATRRCAASSARSARAASAATTRRTSPPDRGRGLHQAVRVRRRAEPDVNETLKNSLARTGSIGVPLDLDYADLAVRQAEYRSSCATVLMLDTSHSMILYGEDRFTPAKKVALALTHLIRTQFPGDTIASCSSTTRPRRSRSRRSRTRRSGPYHTNTAEGLKLARRILLGAEEGHAPDRDDHRRQAERAHDAQRADLQELDGARRDVIGETLKEVAELPRSGIMINTFMLARDRALVEFVKRVSEIAAGKAYFTNTMTLGQFILMDFLRRKTRTVS
jgi:Ca-activated chloride channel family protein